MINVTIILDNEPIKLLRVANELEILRPGIEVGNTTRLADLTIDLLFQGLAVELPPLEKAEVTQIVINRLQVEHGMKLNQIKSKHDLSTIELCK